MLLPTNSRILSILLASLSACALLYPVAECSHQENVQAHYVVVPMELTPVVRVPIDADTSRFVRRSSSQTDKNEIVVDMELVNIAQKIVDRKLEVEAETKRQAIYYLADAAARSKGEISRFPNSFAEHVRAYRLDLASTKPIRSTSVQVSTCQTLTVQSDEDSMDATNPPTVTFKPKKVRNDSDYDSEQGEFDD